MFVKKIVILKLFGTKIIKLIQHQVHILLITAQTLRFVALQRVITNLKYCLPLGNC